MIYDYDAKTKAIADEVRAKPADATNQWHEPVAAAHFVYVAFWIAASASAKEPERIVYFYRGLTENSASIVTIQPFSRHIAKTVVDTGRAPMLIPFHVSTLDRPDFCVGMLQNEASGARIEVLKGLRG